MPEPVGTVLLAEGGCMTATVACLIGHDTQDKNLSLGGSLPQ